MCKRSSKRRNTVANPPHHKQRQVAPTQEPESDSGTSKDDDEVNDTPLTRADIPKIVETVINNKVTDPHLGEWYSAPRI